MSLHAFPPYPSRFHPQETSTALDQSLQGPKWMLNILFYGRQFPTQTIRRR